MPRRGDNIYKRKDGRWEGRYNYTLDSNGKRHYKAVYAHSYQEVKDKMSVLRAERKRPVGSCKMTVKDLCAEWLQAVKLRVKPSTYSCYKLKTDKHLIPEFGNTRFDKISTAKLHDFIDIKMREGLSAKYISDIVVVFKSMTKYISKVYSCFDPLDNVILPKKERKADALLSDEQQKRLCSSISDTYNTTNLSVMLSYYTGLRIGEVCGLKWSDIDFDANTLTVSRTVQRIYDGQTTKVFIGSPKSKSSVRTIPLPEFITERLRQLRARADDFILSGRDRAVEPRTLQYRFKSLLKKVNVPSINFHSLRHMFATNCIRLGFDVKTLSEILGHSSVEVTLNRYVHSSMDRKKACMGMVKKSF